MRGLSLIPDALSAFSWSSYSIACCPQLSWLILNLLLLFIKVKLPFVVTWAWDNELSGHVWMSGAALVKWPMPSFFLNWVLVDVYFFIRIVPFWTGRLRRLAIKNLFSPEVKIWFTSRIFQHFLFYRIIVETSWKSRLIIPILIWLCLLLSSYLSFILWNLL